MNQLSSGKNSGILLLTALVAALLFAIYYYLVLPKQEEVASAQSSVNALQTEIADIQEQSTDLEVDDNQETTNLFALQKKVPQNREVNELLLNIEEIEFVSDTRILSVEFNNYDSLVAESELQDPNYVEPVEEGEEPAEAPVETETETAIDNETEEATEETAAPPVSSIARETLPAQLKMITFSISVESPNAENIEIFLKELETLERVMRIDTLDYYLPGEENEFSQELSETVTATIQVTTFYYEGEQ